jgi:hypothetical protein
MSKKTALWLVLLASLMTAHIWLLRTAERFPPRIMLTAKDYGMDASSAFTPRALEQANRDFASFQKERPGYTKQGVVNVIITNGNYTYHRDFDMAYGAFFPKSAAETGVDLAVIGEGLAFALFNTADAVGSEFDLNGQPYKVCGVFNRNIIYETLTSNGRPDVYIPANSVFDRQNGLDTPVQYMIFIPAAGDLFAVEKLQDDLTMVSQNIRNYEAANYSVNGLAIVRQSLHVTMFAAGAAVFWLLMSFVIRDAKKRYAVLRDAYKLMTLKEALTEHAVYCLTGIVLYAGAGVAALVLYRLCAFTPYIPEALIPAESLFDIEHYKNLILERLWKRRQLYAYQPSAYELFTRYMAAAGAVLMVTEIGCLWAAGIGVLKKR